MAPGDTHVSVCTQTTFGWCLKLPMVPRLHLWQSGAGGELENTRESSTRREGERNRGRVDCLCMRMRGGVGCRAVAEEECRLFPCVGRTGELCWLQSGAVSRNEKSCVGHGGSPRHCRPEAKHSQKIKPQCSSLLASHAANTHGGAQQR